MEQIMSPVDLNQTLPDCEGRLFHSSSEAAGSGVKPRSAPRAWSGAAEGASSISLPLFLFKAGLTCKALLRSLLVHSNSLPSDLC